MSGVSIRDATRADLPALAHMAAMLVRMHHAFDPQRFMLHEPVEQGYGWWLSEQLGQPSTILLVAELDGELVGYAYGALEERDWMLLRDECGALHDVLVVDEARRSGVARALVTTVMERLTALGAKRIVLSTAAKNEGAQRFFDSMGFRRTMIEMTRELS